MFFLARLIKMPRCWDRRVTSVYDDQYAKSYSEVLNSGFGLQTRAPVILGRNAERRSVNERQDGCSVESSVFWTFTNQELSCLTLLPLWVLLAP